MHLRVSNVGASPVDVLVLSLVPYRFATRARKAAFVIAQEWRTAFLSLAAVGRTGVRDRPGSWAIDGVNVSQVEVGPIKQSSGINSRIWNLLIAYAPAHRRLAKAVLRQPSRFVYVTTPALLGLALRHRRKFASDLIIDVPERPGEVVAKGSLATVFARVERRRLASASKQSVLATIAVGEDAAFLRNLGFSAVAEVRNAPLESWRAPFEPLLAKPGTPLRGVLIGSLFESRGLEQLVDSLAILRDRGVAFSVTIAGPGREAYLADLRARAASRNVQDMINWVGPIANEDVSALYLAHDFGFVLYDPATPGNDGLSNKILECVASGRPVLAGDLPQNRRFVDAHRVGWLTEVTARSIADSVTSISQTRGLLSEYAIRCRAFGDEKLTWEAEVRPVLEAMAARVNRGSEPGRPVV